MKLILSVETVRFPLTGIGRYNYELAKELLLSEDISNLRLCSTFGFINSLPIPGDRPTSNYDLKSFVQRSRMATEVYRLLTRMLKGRILKSFGNYLFHGPNYFLPPFSGRCVATFHDLSVFTWPQCFPAERLRFMQKEFNKTIKRADALITDSEFIRRELADYFSWPLERIYSVPLASGQEFHPRNLDELQTPLARYSLKPDGYSLFVSTIEPRKNIDTLLDSYGRLPMALKKRWPLVIIGYQGWRNEKTLDRIQAAQSEGWVRYLGFIPSEDIPLLFAGARLFTFPSHYEGFGLPVLEAMSSGVPVVCSNSSSLPEVAGDAALMCEPNDVDKLTELLHQGLEDDHWRTQAIDRGLARAEQFSWQRCASETIAVYRQVLED